MALKNVLSYQNIPFIKVCRGGFKVDQLLIRNSCLETVASCKLELLVYSVLGIIFIITLFALHYKISQKCWASFGFLALQPECMLYFFLWGHMKNLIYETPVESDEDLVAHILTTAQEIQMTPNIFERVYQNLLRRCNACIEVGSHHYDLL